MATKKSYRTRARITEHLTAALLWAKGYEIIALNKRFGGVEVDVLARRHGTWVVVEVKARQGQDANRENAVSHHQQQRLRRVVAQLAAQHNAPARLDLLLWQPRWPFAAHYQNL